MNRPEFASRQLLPTAVRFLVGAAVCPVVAVGLILIKDNAAALPVPGGVADVVRRVAFGLCMVWPFGVLVGGAWLVRAKLYAGGVGMILGVPLAGVLYGVVYHGWLRFA